MRRLLLASTFVVSSVAAGGQELPVTVLPGQVVTATRLPTLAESVPAGVTVIDRATIESRGYTTLAEALSAVPGLRLVQSGGPGGNASAFLRGTNSNQVLVLIDGVPANDPSDPNGAFNFGVDTLGGVQRIEVVRGPMSGLSGSGAIGGVVNIITNKGQGETHGSVELGAGLPRAAEGQAALSGASGKFDYSLSVGSSSYLGFDTLPKRESVYNGARNSYRSQVATVNLGYTPVPGTRLSVLFRGRGSVFNLDELGSPAFDASHYTGQDNNFLGRIGGTTTLFDGALESSLFVARNVYNRKYVEDLEAADPNQASGTTKYYAQSIDLQWNNTLHLDDRSWATGSAVLFGYQHLNETARSSLNTASAFVPFGTPVPYTASVDASDSSNAGHMGVQTTVLERLTLTADARAEDVRYGGSAFTWRTGGVLAVPEALSRLKLSYGTAFLAPSLFDLFGVDSFGFHGNPNLQPERSTGWEAGWGIDLPLAGRAKAVSMEVTYFHNYVRDLIQIAYAPDYSSSTPVNIARARTQGVEATLTVRPANWLEASASYTYTDARNLTANSLLLRRPYNQASGSLRLTPLAGLTLTPELIYVGAFQDYLVDNNGFPAGVGRSPSGLLFNLTATYDVTPKVQLFANGYNLGNSRFEPANGFQVWGAWFLAGARARF